MIDNAEIAEIAAAGAGASCAASVRESTHACGVGRLLGPLEALLRR